jgi:hypothetical protein
MFDTISTTTPDRRDPTRAVRPLDVVIGGTPGVDFHDADPGERDDALDVIRDEVLADLVFS